MILSRLELTNFRTYKKFSRDLGSMVILVGPNGGGKTNFLEAIYFCSTLRSYRAGSDAEAIRFGEEFAKISGTIMHNREDRDELELVILPKEKKAKINGVGKPLSRLIGTLGAVLFSPEQLEIITGPPRRRRRFLDALLSQVDQRYTLNMLEYQKALQNRNILLAHIKAGGASATELYFWDKRLVESGVKIFAEREKLVSNFNKKLPVLYKDLTESDDPLTIVPSFCRLTFEILRDRLPLDIQLSATTAGPHRDNFILRVGTRELGPFGSRGEWRSALLVMKAAEAKFIRDKKGEDPVFLLDDVFSELDTARRTRLFPLLGEGQTFLTTTDLDRVPSSLRRSEQIIEVANNAK